MNWLKPIAKFVKHGVITGVSAAAAVIHATPAGDAIDWASVASVALVSALLSGLGGGSANVAKHLRR